MVRRARKEVSIRQRYYSGEEGQPFPPGPSAVILVSHGDTLAMLQCLLAGRPVEGHRSLLPHLENCGIRVFRPPPDEAAAAAAVAAEASDPTRSESSSAGAEEAVVAEGRDCREGGGGGDCGGVGGDVVFGKKGPGAEGETGAGGEAGAFKMTGARVFRRPGKEGEGGGKKDVGGDATGE